MKHSPSSTSTTKHRHHYIEPFDYQPRINQKSICLSRTVQDLIKWQEMKQTKQQMLRTYFDMVSEANKAPLCYTNEISNEILRYTRSDRMPIEDLLLQKGREKQDKLRRIEDQLYGRERIPQITKTAKQMRRDQPIYESRLYGLTKQENKEPQTDKKQQQQQAKSKFFKSYLHHSQQPIHQSSSNIFVSPTSQKKSSSHPYQHLQNLLQRWRSQRPDESISSTNKPKVKECYFSLLPHTQQHYSTIGTNTNQTHGSVKAKQRQAQSPSGKSPSTKSSTLRSPRSGKVSSKGSMMMRKADKENRMPSPDYALRMSGQKSDTLNKVYRYILERD